MGTRSITTVRSRWENGEWETFAHIYRHYDGYLAGQGTLLFEFLNGLEVINGIPQNPSPKYANGPGALAAQLVVCMYQNHAEPQLRPDASPVGQEFHYQIDVNYGMGGGQVSITVFKGPMTAFGLGGEQCTEKIFEGSVPVYGLFLKDSYYEVSL